MACGLQGATGVRGVAWLVCACALPSRGLRTFKSRTNNSIRAAMLVTVPSLETAAAAPRKWRHPRHVRRVPQSRTAQYARRCTVFHANPVEKSTSQRIYFRSAIVCSLSQGIPARASFVWGKLDVLRAQATVVISTPTPSAATPYSIKIQANTHDLTNKKLLSRLRLA